MTSRYLDLVNGGFAVLIAGEDQSRTVRRKFGEVLAGFSMRQAEKPGTVRVHKIKFRVAVVFTHYCHALAVGWKRNRSPAKTLRGKKLFVVGRSNVQFKKLQAVAISIA